MDDDATLRSADGLDPTVRSGCGSATPSSATIPEALPGSADWPSLTRSTVLPRVALVEDRPTLVVDQRHRFEPVGRLGAGGAGEVLRALDHDIGRHVALKRLRERARSPEALLRFVSEIRTVGLLEHPNVVPIHDVGVDERGEYYFVMKLVEGETLRDVIARLAAGDPATHARYTFERRTQIFRALLEAVAFAHSRGIVHRDIKPANVMVGAFGEVQLMDWGAAKSIRGDGPSVDAALLPRPDEGGDEVVRLFSTRYGSLVGTPAYMSPEQARGEPVDERSDIYSLCVLFHELLCLRHYLADRKTLPVMLHGVQEHDPTAAAFVPSPHQPPVPAELSWFARQGMAKDPAERFPSVAAMIERLDRRAEGVFPVQCAVTLLKRGSTLWARFVDRHPGLAMSGAGLGLLALLGAIVWLLVR